MKLANLTKEQQAWCQEQVARNIDTEIRKVHSKSQLAKSLNMAFRNMYGCAWPGFTADTISTICKRLKKDENMEIRPDPDNKGILCTWGKRHNQHPAVFDQAESIRAMQQRAASLIENQVSQPTIRLTVEMIPAARISLPATRQTVKQIEAGNREILDAARNAVQATRVRYITKLVPVDENGRELTAGELQG